MDGYFRRGMAAPDLMSICIDQRSENGSTGRLYCRCGRTGKIFKNEYQLLKLMEKVMDEIDYPQSSVEMRSYQKKIESVRKRAALSVSSEEVAAQKGRCATFLVHVQYRQNATWQGEIMWMEKKKIQTFRSALELLKLLDSAR